MLLAWLGGGGGRWESRGEEKCEQQEFDLWLFSQASSFQEQTADFLQAPAAEPLVSEGNLPPGETAGRVCVNKRAVLFQLKDFRFRRAVCLHFFCFNTSKVHKETPPPLAPPCRRRERRGGRAARSRRGARWRAGSLPRHYGDQHCVET